MALPAWLTRVTPARIAIGTGFLFALVHFIATSLRKEIPVFTQVINRAESIFMDVKFKERGERKVSGDVVVAAIDEKSIDKYGRFPWPRGIQAALVDRLTEEGASAIAFDVSYSDEDHSGAFAGAKRFRDRFNDVSLSGQRGQSALQKLSLGRTASDAAASTLDDVRDELDSGDLRELNERLKKAQKELSDAVKSFAELQKANTEYLDELTREVRSISPDAAFAESVQKSGKVVLGYFMLTDKDLAHVSKEDREKNVKQVEAWSLPGITHVSAAPTGEVPVLTPIDGVGLVPQYPAPEAPLPIIADASDLGGFFNVEPDPDGKIRRERLITATNGLILPGLTLGAVMRHYGKVPFDVTLASADTSLGQIESIRMPLDDGNELQIPTDARGEMLINFHGPEGTFTAYSIADIIGHKTPPGALKNRIVFVGATAIGTFDQRVTPFDRLAPGVYVHTAAAENILHRDFLRRPWWALPFELVLLFGLAAIFGYVFSRVKPFLGIAAMVGVGLTYHALDYGLFRAGYVVFSALPLLEMLVIFVAMTVFQYVVVDKEKRQIRGAFEKYVTASVMEQVLKDPSKLALGGEQRECTVMFSDIRGFTTISEKLPPQKLTALLNEYLTPMTDLVFKHEGTLDKYIGDAIMAVYGAPLDLPEHALAASRTALEMMEELRKLQIKWREQGYPDIDIGIGLNTGIMSVGNMGSKQRFEYTAIGDNVNLSSRLEGINKDYGTHIVISENTYGVVKDKVVVRELDAVRVKGKKAPVHIYELLGLQPATEEQRDQVERFMRGLQMYREQKWDEAAAVFNGMVEKWPDDKPAKLYVERCKEMKAAPPGPDWDGVFVMTHK